MARELINALAGNVECVTELSEAEQLILSEIEPQRIHCDKGSVVFREGEPAHSFLLVEHGICFNHRHLEDGSRQIIDLYFPGEMVALGELSSAYHSSGLTAFSDAVILGYDKAEIKERFSRSPSLSRLFIELMSQEQANLTERLVGVSRHCARQRVAHFLLEVHFRSSRAMNFNSRVPRPSIFEIGQPENGRSALVSIPQVLIADALGLSVVHVNRVLRQFRQEALTQTQCHGIEILDLEGLKSVAGWLSAAPRIAPAQMPQISK